MREVTGNNSIQFNSIQFNSIQFNSIGATTEQDRNQLLIGVGFGSGLLIGLAAYLSAPSRRLIDALLQHPRPETNRLAHVA